MRALFCDMCGAQIKSLPAHFDSGSPAIINERMEIIDGGDYCTLFTCTPYGINTHRLLVRGIRIETIKEKPVIYVSNEAFRIEPLLVTPAVAAPMLLVLLIHLLVKYREPPKKKPEGGTKLAP